MTIDSFIKKRDQLKSQPLDDLVRHPSLSQLRRERQTQLKEIGNSYRISAVAIVVYEQSNQAKFVLIQRAESKGVHSKQMALPGGQMEDVDQGVLLNTAMRETEEEIGIPRNELKFVRSLSSIYVPPSRFMIYPHLFYLNTAPKFSLQSTEVAAVITPSLDDLLDEKTMEVGDVKLPNGKEITAPYYLLERKKVWGATAIILEELKQLLLQAGG